MDTFQIYLRHKTNLALNKELHEIADEWCVLAAFLPLLCLQHLRGVVWLT